MDKAIEYVASLTPVEPIGEGAFGEVHRYKCPLHGEVAVKRFFQSKFGSAEAWEEACKDALQEARNLKALEHGHVVKIHQVLRTGDGDEFLLVMEYCEGKSIREMTQKDVVSLPEAKRVIRDAAIGLNYIHNNHYLHRDIKPDNILLKGDGRVKVGDFGFVTNELQFGFATPYGTAIYWAPEVLKELACSAISDVYSLGVTFINMISGDHWFFREGKGQVVVTGADGDPELSSNMLYLPHVPTSWRNVANKLCRPLTSNRCPSLDAAVNSIAKLPAVEPWICTVGEDVISWQLEKGKRRVRVEWQDYLGRPGDKWTAWSEDLSGGSKRKLSSSPPGAKWKETYKSLQKFFEDRTP
ncbi:serine/threonine-protein kinase [Rhizobium leguminosarum]